MQTCLHAPAQVYFCFIRNIYDKRHAPACLHSRMYTLFFNFRMTARQITLTQDTLCRKYFAIHLLRYYFIADLYLYRCHSLKTVPNTKNYTTILESSIIPTYFPLTSIVEVPFVVAKRVSAPLRWNMATTLRQRRVDSNEYS